MNPIALSAPLKARIDSAFPAVARAARDLARFLHQNPELALQEEKAAARIATILAAAGFRVSRGLAGMPTAFRAEFGRGGKTVAFLAEYDALPGLGHACGHNLIAGASVGAALTLARALPGTGRVVLLGTPAEETLGGKIPLLDSGAFAGIDLCFLAHPSNQTRLHSSSLALASIEVTFQGKAAHAAAAPEKGVNALDALIQLFHSLGFLRSQLPSGSRVDGVILEGGRAANIVPDFTRASFFLRARSLRRLAEVRNHFVRLVRAAELSTGARSRLLARGPVYAPFLSHPVLGAVFQVFGRNLGLRFTASGETALGSSDIGNISQVIPCLHPTYAICPPGLVEHSPEFARAAGSEKGIREMLKVARALAQTGAYLLSRPGLFPQIRSEQRKLLRAE